MTTELGALFGALTVIDYAGLAFGVGGDGKPSAGFEGGVYAGRGTVWERPAEGDSAAGARLVPVRAGKVFVRWCDWQALCGAWTRKPPANADKLPRWAPAAGPWWVSDNQAEMIADETVKRFGGPGGDSGQIAREFCAVKYEWGSNMRGVLVCRTKVPLRVLIGVGRQVQTKAFGASQPASLGDRDLQYVLLTELPRGTFRAHEFLEVVRICRSTEFVAWWRDAQILSRRGRARAGAPPIGVRPSNAGGYPSGVKRAP